MRGTLKAIRPDDIEVQVTMTLTIGEARAIEKQIDTDGFRGRIVPHPLNEFAMILRSVIRHGDKHFSEVSPPPSGSAVNYS